MAASQKKRFADYVCEERVRSGFNVREDIPGETLDGQNNMMTAMMELEEQGILPSDWRVEQICTLLGLDYSKMLPIVEEDRLAKHGKESPYPLSPAKERFVLQLGKIEISSGMSEEEIIDFCLSALERATL